jgi:nucleoside-diphosphate-sugar epimerase
VPLRVLVTGGSGFIGSAAVRSLAAGDADVVTVGRGSANDIVADLTKAGSADEVVARVRPDRVAHLAWPEDDRIDSLTALDWVGHTAALLRSCLDHGVGHIVTAGTCFEYALGSPEPLKAGVSLERPATIYGAAKLAVRHLVEGLVASGNAEAAHARVFYVYGEGERPPRLVPTVGLGLLRGEDVATTAGTQRRDFLHVDDVGAALALLCSEAASGTFDVASGTASRVSELIDGLEARIPSGHVRRGALALREGDPEVIVGDPRALLALGWRPRVSLDEGLDRTVDWLRAILEERPSYE